jgi:hypothetical protein
VLSWLGALWFSPQRTNAKRVPVLLYPDRSAFRHGIATCLWCVCLVSLSEVRQSLTSAQQQYSQWSMLLDSDVDPEKVQSVGSELKNLIKSIEWDLEDLDQTISIPLSF